ncbi:tRNA (adenosine(37)-N6)-threonylcarbamoyltransferase complex transferase subunit TsaD [Candidatus Woesearchaeota archaeon]|jgi:N6-L-threonylcarbamoyladenine synthase|nr:tRNA (adenosine(37)-N6)-threonylcarbamoyltransferase complex transferase subunit TsaD [Candidatus Woesearchaeota archaeon]
MIILGVESTAHTFGVGIVDSNGERVPQGSSKARTEGKVLANVFERYSSKDIGMVPDEVMEHHERVAEDVLVKALEEAKVSWKEVDFIAYSAGPGIDPVLWCGYHIVKKWASEQGKRLIGVNHCAAHLSVGKMWNKLENPCYLYVSGVNTQIIVSEGGKYRIMGETLDIGLGNMLDKLGRVLGLGFPAGPKIEELAKKGKYIELPYVVKGMDTSFSGILTKCKQLVEKGINKEDLCFSVQETCFAMLAEVVERAMAHNDKQELLLVGGVGANKRFCEMLEMMCQERGAKFYKVPMDLAGDQGAMIAWEGYLRREESGDIEVNAQWRTDEV